MGFIELMIIVGLAIAGLLVVIIVSAVVRQRERGPSGSFGPMPEDQRPTLDGVSMQQIMDLIRSKRKIEAIKVFREHTGAGLAEAKEAVETLEQNLKMPGTSPGGAPYRSHETDSGSLESVRELIRANKMIEAIKLYREMTGLGLKEAKDAVDEMKRTL